MVSSAEFVNRLDKRFFLVWYLIVLEILRVVIVIAQRKVSEC